VESNLKIDVLLSNQALKNAPHTVAHSALAANLQLRPNFLQAD
jgi:hypothetical protein